jgi:hypothetical protein
MTAMLQAEPSDSPNILQFPLSLQARYQPLQRAMIDQLERTAALENHWLIFSLLGWENLLACGASYYLLEIARQSPYTRWPFVLIWSAQVVAALLTIKLISGIPRIEDSPLQAVVRRVGAVFILLCCNVAVLGTIAGFPVTTFLPILSTVSSFALLVLAIVISAKFIIAGLFMFVAGSLMAMFPQYAFLTYGVAWLVVLQSLGILFALKRRRWLNTIPARD